jgi:class 3 adenylate cyclase
LEWAARSERLAASPGTAGLLVDASFRSDVRDLLPTLHAPTLVLHTGDLGHVDLEHSHYLAENIPGAELVELRSTLPYWSDEQPYLLAKWLTGGTPPSGDPSIVSVMFIDIVDSTARVAAAGDEQWQRTLSYFNDFVETTTAAHQGRIVKSTGDGHLLDFGSPRHAIAAAIALHDGLRSYGLVIRSGLHTGEVLRGDDGDLHGIAVHIAARVAALAAPGELLVSRTVADLLVGTEITFDDRGEHELKGVSGRWPVLALNPRTPP